MDTIFWAKSNPKETIKEHTDKLLENLQILKNEYGKQITKNINMEEDRFWKLMSIICTYHDTGKVFFFF